MTSAEYQREWRKNNPGKTAEYNRNWKANHTSEGQKEKMREYMRAWRAKNRPPKGNGTGTCQVCGKEFTKANNRQIYCSAECVVKSPMYQNKERRKHAKQAAILAIGRHIRDEALGLPTYGSKSLWDGIGKWNRRYDFCEECQTTVYKYFSNGLCVKCYSILRSRDPEELKQSQDNPERRQKTRADKISWVKRAQNGEITITPTISNLLANLETEEKP